MRQQHRQSHRVFTAAATIAALLATGITLAKSRDVAELDGVALEVGLGDVVTVPETGFELRFSEVVLDSRCPQDVTCMRAGEVVIRAELCRPGMEGEFAELALGPDHPGENKAMLLGYGVTLLEVMPYPSGFTPVDPAAYSATLMIERPRRRVRERGADKVERQCLESALTFVQLSDDRLQVALDVRYHCSERVTLSAWLEIGGRRIADPAQMEGGRRLIVEQDVQVGDGSQLRICGGVEHVVAGSSGAEPSQHEICRTYDGDLPPGIGG